MNPCGAYEDQFVPPWAKAHLLSEDGLTAQLDDPKAVEAPALKQGQEQAQAEIDEAAAD